MIVACLHDALGYNSFMNENTDMANTFKPTRLRIKDKRGRVLLQINPDGKIAIARFDDSTENERAKVLSICKAVIQDNLNMHMDLEKVRKFICFESDDDEFCS